MRSLLPVLAVTLSMAMAGPACQRGTEAREEAAWRATTAALDDLEIDVVGGVVVDATEADGPDHPARLRVRATSFDLQLVVRDSGCETRDVEVLVDNVPTEADWSWRVWRGALTAAAQAEHQCCGAVLTTDAAQLHPDWTPLGPDAKYVPGHVSRSLSADGESRTLCRATGAGAVAGVATGDAVTRRCWRLRLEPATDRAEIRPPEDDAPAPPTLACAGFDTAAGGPLRHAPLITEHRAVWRPAPTALESGAAGVRFVVMGNHAGQSGLRQAAVRAVAERVDTQEVRFVLLSGDLAESGSPSSLDAAVADLDRLPVPWFATVGDRDVDGASAGGLVSRFGRLTDTFDVRSQGGLVALRVVLLDSADGGLSRAAFRSLDTWLADELAPEARIVVTHTPPFEPSGLRGKAFKSRVEAARLVAALKRGLVYDLFTSHLAIYEKQTVGDLTIWHSGGGGAPMESLDQDPHHFLIVTVNQSGAIFVERVDL